MVDICFCALLSSISFCVLNAIVYRNHKYTIDTTKSILEVFDYHYDFIKMNKSRMNDLEKELLYLREQMDKKDK